ncbi:hypothetical protein [Pseudomonas protegens]|uniref:hypothetical protein n=1 Tax=Pseudomonas protegens TaxID=380021 RepID=UPI001614A835|nr:hypothetical protein [Pseudomonas protegens]
MIQAQRLKNRPCAGFFVRVAQGFAILDAAVPLFQERTMPRETTANVEPSPAQLQVINDPGNEDPGSLMDDALVPLQEGPEDGDGKPDPDD